MISKIIQFFLWLFVWLLLSWPPEPKDLITGLLVSAFVLLMTIDIFSGLYEGEDRKISGAKGLLGGLQKFLWFLCYVAVFIWECVKANFDVAYRVICPDLPIKPGTVKVKINLKSDIGITFLANSLTLTPGNTSIDVDKTNGFIYVHRLYLGEDSGGFPARLAVVEKFEKILMKIFG